MSNSLGNFINLEDLDDYANRFGLDAVRYFLASNGPLGTTDSDFAEAKFIEVYNTDLANTLGNCFSRISNMTNRYFGGELPKSIDESSLNSKLVRGEVIPWKVIAEASIADHGLRMSELDLSSACLTTRELVTHIDDYIEQTAPFKLAKDPAKLPEVGTILYHCAEAIRIASVLLWPVMPGKMEELWRRIGCPHYAEALANNGRGQLKEWTQWGLLQPGTPILQGEALFPRYQPPKG